MKNKVILITLAVVFLSSCQSSMNRFTQDDRGANTYSSTETGQLSSVTEDTKCDNSSSCVSSKYFTANIERISKRGKVVIIQIKYLSKINTFDADFKDGYVLLLDSNGNEFKVAGNSVSKFKIRKGSFRVLSFRFKGSDKTPIISPFDLTIKASDEHGEITFFDLEPLKKK